MRFDVGLGSSVGVAVHELEPVLELYTEGLGLGPFEVEEVEVESEEVDGGRTAASRLRIASAPLGVCEMELIEVLAGRPPHAEFLDAHGEGMNHFNLDKRTAEGYLATLSDLYWRGVEPFWGLPFTSFCYVESERVGGVTFEVMVGSGHAGKKGHNHLGLVVEDTAKTIDFYTGPLGLPPFRTGEFPMPRAYYREKRIETSFRASFCDIGDCRLRLFETVAGDSPFATHVKTRGEGMHHLCLVVEDLDACLAELRADGVGATWRASGLELALLDTTKIGGMTFAIAQATDPAGSISRGA